MNCSSLGSAKLIQLNESKKQKKDTFIIRKSTPKGGGVRGSNRVDYRVKPDVCVKYSTTIQPTDSIINPINPINSIVKQVRSSRIMSSL